MKTTNAKVIVVWKQSAKQADVNVLVFGGGDARIYDKDEIDGRSYLGEDLPPFFDTLAPALDYMTSNPGKVCQLELKLANRCGLV